MSFIAEIKSFSVDYAIHPAAAFRSVLPYALFGIVVLIVVHFGLSWFGGRAAARHSRWNWWERLVYLGVLGSVGLLGATAFFGVLRFGALHGWLLFAHMFGAGAFVAVLPVVALTWCEANRFVRGRAPRGALATAGTAPRFFWLPKAMFWILLAGGLVVSLTMLVSMLPLYGTEGLEQLLDLHRYSGLLVVAATVFHFYSVLLQRIGWR